MKQIDRLLLGSFLGPFAISFGIALFVLVMQFLWVYIDDIAGKGISIFLLAELIGYLSVSTFPMALPIAVLLSSVMVTGNLAERYELSSFKSAGVSLLRIMRSLVIASAMIAIFSYVCSDFLIPKANLQFKSRLYDIRKQKPALAVEPGIFNEDFRQFVMRVGRKDRKGDGISEILIEDNSQIGNVRFNQILADSGRMFTARDKRYFVMELYNGMQYQEPASGASGNASSRYPFVRTKFKTWTKVWDLGEFEMNRTDEERFKGQRVTLSMAQLRDYMDSLGRDISTTKQALADDLLTNVRKKPQPPPASELRLQDSLRRALVEKVRRSQQAPANADLGLPHAPQGPDLPRQRAPYIDAGSEDFLGSFQAEYHAALRREASNRLRTALISLETRASQAESRRLDYVKTGYELYSKYSFALVCVIFMFIGAPMGALIRKGGFGYPILVSIIFFVTFVMLAITCKKLAELYILPPFWAAMTPCLALLPISALVTFKAMNDSNLFSTERIDALLTRLRQWLERKFKLHSTHTDTLD
ncbi:MAG: LptF/LptG family permease [Saprospiraceae bacterium]